MIQTFQLLAVLAILMLAVCVLLGILTACLERRIEQLYKKLRELEEKKRTT